MNALTRNRHFGDSLKKYLSSLGKPSSSEAEKATPDQEARAKLRALTIGDVVREPDL